MKEGMKKLKHRQITNFDVSLTKEATNQSVKGS